MGIQFGSSMNHDERYNRDCPPELEENAPPDPDDILGTKDVARLLRVSTQTIRRMIKIGKLKAVLVRDETHTKSRYEIRRGDVPEVDKGHVLTPEEIRAKYGNADGSPLSPDDLLVA